MHASAPSALDFSQMSEQRVPFLLFSLQDEAMFYLKSYTQISIVNLDATVKRSRSLKTSVGSC